MNKVTGVEIELKSVQSNVQISAKYRAIRAEELLLSLTEEVFGSSGSTDHAK